MTGRIAKVGQHLKHLKPRAVLLLCFSFTCLFSVGYCYFISLGERQVYIVAEYNPNSLKVAEIYEDQAGYPAGLRLGDVITAIDGQAVDTYFSHNDTGIVEFRDYPYYYYPLKFYKWPFSAGQRLGIMSLQGRLLTVSRPGLSQVIRVDLDSFSANANAFVLLNATFLAAMVFWLSAFVVLLSKPNEPITSPLSFAFNLAAIYLMSSAAKETQLTPILYSFSAIATFFGSAAFFHLMLYFPSGRRPQFWLRNFLFLSYLFNLALVIATFIVSFMLPDRNIEIINVLRSVVSVEGYAFDAGCIFLLVKRFISSRGIERVRIRVVTASILFVIIYTLGVVTSEFLFGWFVSTLEYEASLVYLGMVIIPIAFVYSILRYNLFFADLIIRSSLTYTLLTGFLGILFFGLNNILSLLIFHSFGSRDSGLSFLSLIVVVLATNKGKTLCQNFVDTVFYRSNLDYPALIDKWTGKLVSSSTNLVELLKLTNELSQDFQYVSIAVMLTEQVRSVSEPGTNETETEMELLKPYRFAVISSQIPADITQFGDITFATDGTTTPLLVEDGILNFLENTEFSSALRIQETVLPATDVKPFVENNPSQKSDIIEFIPVIKDINLESYQFLILFPNIPAMDWIGGLLVGQKKSGELPTPSERRALNVVTKQLGQALFTALKVQEQLASYRIIQQLFVEQDTLIEKERLGLSHEIHDTLKQMVFGLNEFVDAWSVKNTAIVDKSPEISQLLGVLQYRASTLMEQTQSLLKQLRSNVLIEEGGSVALIAAIQEIILEATNTKQDVGFSFRPNFNQVEPRLLAYLTTDLNIHVSRIIKQSVENALQHSGCTEIKVLLNIIQVEEAIPCLVVEIQDNGQGFNADNLNFNQLVKNRHFGLQGMRERVIQNGGRFNIISNRAGGGTTVRATFPLQQSPTTKLKFAKKFELAQKKLVA